MPTLSPTSVKALEEELRTAVSASLSLRAAERPAYIGRHLLAVLNGDAPPASPPLDLPAVAVGLAEELPPLQAVLSNAVQAANDSVDTAPPLKLVADFLLSAAATANASASLGSPPTSRPAWDRQQRPGKEPEARAAPPHFGTDALLESVASGAIAPLRGQWLVELEARGGRLVRRQDLPPEAFFSIGELRRLVKALGDDYGLLFVALSYRWLSKVGGARGGTSHPYTHTHTHYAHIRSAARRRITRTRTASTSPS